MRHRAALALVAVLVIAAPAFAGRMPGFSARVNEANRLKNAPPTDDTVPVGNGSAFQAKTLPDCDASGQKLLYDQATNAFSCGTDLTSVIIPAAETKYVDPAGTDSGTTVCDAANPCKTLGHSGVFGAISRANDNGAVVCANDPSQSAMRCSNSTEQVCTVSADCTTDALETCVSGRCMRTCNENTDCATNGVCSEYTCADHAYEGCAFKCSTTTAQHCLVDAHCPIGETCTTTPVTANNTCATAGQGCAPDNSNSRCTSGGADNTIPLRRRKLYGVEVTTGVYPLCLNGTDQIPSPGWVIVNGRDRDGTVLSCSSVAAGSIAFDLTSRGWVGFNHIGFEAPAGDGYTLGAKGNLWYTILCNDCSIRYGGAGGGVYLGRGAVTTNLLNTWIWQFSSATSGIGYRARLQPAKVCKNDATRPCNVDAQCVSSTCTGRVCWTAPETPCTVNADCPGSGKCGAGIGAEVGSQTAGGVLVGADAASTVDASSEGTFCQGGGGYGPCLWYDPVAGGSSFNNYVQLPHIQTSDNSSSIETIGMQVGPDTCAAGPTPVPTPTAGPTQNPTATSVGQTPPVATVTAVPTVTAPGTPIPSPTANALCGQTVVTIRGGEVAPIPSGSLALTQADAGLALDGDVTLAAPNPLVYSASRRLIRSRCVGGTNHAALCAVNADCPGAGVCTTARLSYCDTQTPPRWCGGKGDLGIIDADAPRGPSIPTPAGTPVLTDSTGGGGTLPISTQYCYKLAPRTEYGENGTALSAGTCVTTSGAGGSTHKVALSLARSQFATKYNVYRSTTLGGTYGVICGGAQTCPTDGGNGTSVAFTDLGTQAPGAAPSVTDTSYRGYCVAGESWTPTTNLTRPTECLTTGPIASPSTTTANHALWEAVTTVEGGNLWIKDALGTVWGRIWDLGSVGLFFESWGRPFLSLAGKDAAGSNAKTYLLCRYSDGLCDVLGAPTTVSGIATKTYVDTGTIAFGNKTISGGDAAAGTTRPASPNNNIIQIRSHNTDCTSLTDGKQGEVCLDEDDFKVWLCMPSSGDCDTPAEWKYVTGQNPTLDGTVAQLLSVARHPTAGQAGNVLAVQSGGAASGATNAAAGDLTIKTGVPTGTGSAKIIFQEPHPAATPGTTTDKALLSVLQLRDGHLVGLGLTPVVSACGTSPSISGTDIAGKVTVGSGATSSCTITFAKAYTTNAPACALLGSDNGIRYGITTTTSAITVTSSASMAAFVLNYVCIGVE